MAVPAHDERDFDFATRYRLPIKVVVAPDGWSGGALDEAYTEAGTIVNSGEFDGLASDDAKQKIIEKVEQAGSGERRVTYRLRDWLISRQRYWGAPIPIVYCDTHGAQAVPEDQLPVVLPFVEEFRPTGTDESPLAQVESFAQTTCPECGGPARRETDVSDTFLDSSWYFLRYPSTEFDSIPFDATLTKKWLPVHSYIGGKEHSVLHLLYSRFITMALHDLGHIQFEEPFSKFRAHGLLILRGSKISKSRGNVVNPDDYVASHGADTLRTYLMFSGRYDEGGDFSDKGIGGVFRFLNRVWDAVQRYKAQGADSEMSAEAQQRVHRTIERVTRDVGNLEYNTAIAFLMEYMNSLQERPALHRDEVRTLLLLLAPFAPYVTEELWEQLGEPYSIHQQAWPVANAELAREREVAVAVQINGKTRDVLQLAVGLSETEAIERARGSEKVQRHIDGATVVRTIYVPDRLINFVVKA
jgi:leucyl-tRNA synthetase